MVDSHAYRLGRLAAQMDPRKTDLLEEMKKWGGEQAGKLGEGVGNAYNQFMPDPGKAILGGVGNLLDFSNEHVTRPGMGELYRRAARGELGGLNPQQIDIAFWTALGGPAGGAGAPQTLLDAYRKYSPQQIQRMAQAPGGREAFEAAFENDPLGKLAFESVLDPLNLAGVGVGRAVGKGLVSATTKAAGAGSKAERVATGAGRLIEAADVAIDRAQALPITIPIATVRKTGQLADWATGGFVSKALARNPESVARRGMGDVESAVEAERAAGETNIARRLYETVYNQADAAPDKAGYFSTIDPHSVYRVAQESDIRGNASLGAEAVNYLNTMGLATRTGRGSSARLVPSERLVAHSRLDDALVNQQFGGLSKDVTHDLLDSYATLVFRDNPKAFGGKLENVYKSLNFTTTSGTDRFSGSLHQNWVQALDSAPMRREIEKLAPRQAVESLLTQTGAANPNLERWYQRSAQTIYHLGFDNSKFFEDPSLMNAVLDSSSAQKVKLDLNLSDEEILPHLQDISKQDVFLALLSGTSVRSKPAANFFQALDGYRALLNGQSLDDVINGLDLKAEKVVARLLLPEGLLPIDYLRQLRQAEGVEGVLPKKGRLQAGFEFVQGQFPAKLSGSGVAHGVPDKLEQYFQSFKGELKAVEAYYASRTDGASHADALKTMNQEREASNVFVHDTWSRLGYLPRERWIDADAILRGEVPALAKDASTEDVLGKQARLPAGVAAWQAAKTRIAEDYAYLTGKPNPITGVHSDEISPQSIEWERRLPNLAAYQSRLWAIFRVEGDLARRILTDLKNPKTGLLDTWRQQAYQRIGETGDEAAGAAEIGKLFTEELRRRLDEAVTQHSDMLSRAEDYDAPVRLETSPGLRTQPFNSPEDLGALAAASGEDTIRRQVELRQFAEGRRKALPEAPSQDLSMAYKAIAEEVKAPKPSGEVGYQLPDNRVIPYTALEGEAGKTIPASEAIFRGEYGFLQQLRDFTQQVRGTFSTQGPGKFGELTSPNRSPAKFLIRVTPMANITTVPHELEHLVLRTSGPESLKIQSQAAYGKKVPGKWTESGAEKLAEGGENFLLDVDLSLLSDPGLRTALHQYRQLADAAYVRGRPRGKLGPTAEELRLALLEGKPKPPVPIGATAPAAGPPDSPLPQVVDDVAEVSAPVPEAPAESLTALPSGVADPEEIVNDLGMAYRRTSTGTPSYTTGPAEGDIAPRYGAPIKEVMDQIGGELRAQPSAIDAATKLVEDLFQRSDNPVASDMLAASSAPYREHIEALIEAPTDAARNEALQQLAREMNATWHGFGVIMPRLMGFIDTILLKNKPTPKVAGTLGRSNFMSALPDEQAKLLQEARSHPEIQKWEADYATAYQDVQTLATRLGFTVADLTSIKEVRKWGLSLKAKADRDVVDAWVKLGGWTDPSTGTVRSLYAAGLAEQWYFANAKALGIDPTKAPPGPIRQALSTARRAWTEQALASPRNLLANLQDMAFKTVTQGYMPLIGESAYTKALKWKIAVPSTVDDPRGIGKATLPSGLTEAATADQMVLRNVPLIGGWNGFWRNLNHTSESTVRTWAWAGEIMNYLHDFQPVYIAEVQRKAGKPLADALKAKNTDFSAEDVVSEASRLGVEPAIANDLSAIWHRNLGEASLRGEKAADRVHFDYTDERNIEKWVNLRGLLAFHFWATRNLAYYTQTMAQNPWMLRTWHSYHELSEEERQRTGLTGRFRETIPFITRDPFLASLLGPNTPYFNPLVVMSIADQMKPIGEDPDMPLPGKILTQAKRVGLGPAPWIDLPLTAAGVYGKDYEAGNVLRLSGLASAGLSTATGKAIDIEAPLKAAIDAARGASTPLSRETLGGIPVGGSRLQDYLIEKKLVEMSVEKEGVPNHPNYVQAMTNPESPLYQQAAAQVYQDQLGGAATGFVSPIPTKVLGDTEAAIQQRRADIRPFMEQLPEQAKKEANRMLAQTGDLATSYWRVGSDPKVAVIQAGLAALDQYSRGPAGTLARQMELSGNPLLNSYLRWLQSLPPFTQDRSPADFVKTLP